MARSSLCCDEFKSYVIHCSLRKRGAMIRLLAVVIFSLTGLSWLSIQSPVPVLNEPRHHLKFENEYVRVFDVVVPPGDTTLFHIHSNDYAYVGIGPATLKAEVLGSGAIQDLILKDGEARFTKGPITHRVTNIASSPFRN